MKRKFNLGDRVRIVAKCHYLGRVTTVVAVDVEACPVCGLKIRDFTDQPVYALDLPAKATMHSGAGCLALSEESDLVPHYDGNELAKWSECVWQPIRESA